MKPEEIKALITEATQPLTEKVTLLESTSTSQAATIAAQALQLKCHNAGIAPTATLLESFKDKDAAYIDGKLSEMAAEQIKESGGKKKNPPAGGTGSENYERVKKELGVKRGA